MIIDLPNGDSIDVPDDAPPQVMQAIRQKVAGIVAQAPAQQEPPGKLESFGRDLIGGFGRAAAMAPRAAQMIAGTFGHSDTTPDKSGTTTNPRTNALARTLGDAADSTEQYWDEFAGKSTNPKLAQMMARGAGGAMAGGAPTPIAAVAGASAGAGGFVGSKLAPGNPLAQGLAELAGGVLGGGAASLASRARPQSANLAREAMEGMSPAQLEKAAAYQAQAKAAGHDIDLAQALVATNPGGAGNLESIRNMLAGRSQGNEVQRVLRGQPQALTTEAELTSRSLPGYNYSPEQNAANLQETATAAIKKATDSRSAQVKGLYAKAGDLPPAARDELVDLVKGMINKPGASEVLQAKGQEIIRKLSGQDDTLAMAVTSAKERLNTATSASERAAARADLAAANAAVASATTKPLKALDVDTWIGELAGPFKGQPLKVAYPRERGQVKGLAGTLNNRFQELSPEVAAAEREFKRITETTINPLKQGPVGTLTQAGGYDPATAAMVSKFDGMMNNGVDPTARISSVKTAAKELAKVDPDAFESSFKGWVSRKVQDAMEEGTKESPLPSDPAFPAKLYDTMFRSKLRWQGIKDATAQMAEIRGEKPEEVIRGLEALKTLTVAMKSNPGKAGGISPTDLKRLGGSSAIANTVRVASFLPANRLGEGIERTILGNTLEQFDRILTQPDGHKMLIELGKVPVMSRQAQVILGTFGSMHSDSPTD